MAMVKLVELAKSLRSKNAGVDKITFDIVFPDKEKYELVKKSGVLSREAICRIYNIPPEKIADYAEYDAANAIKFTLYREQPSGSPGDPDILGCQQYAPLTEIEVPI